MSRTTIRFALFTAMAFGHCAAAQDATPAYAIDLELARCTDATDGVDLPMRECVNQAHEAWDAQMNSTYGKLIADMAPVQREAMREAQRRWLTFRDAECAAIWELHGKDSGTLGRLMVANACMDLVRQRALALAAHRESLEM